MKTVKVGIKTVKVVMERKGESEHEMHTCDSEQLYVSLKPHIVP